MTAEYRFLKCLSEGCGNVFKSNVQTKYPQCSKCRKSNFIVVEKGKEFESLEMKRLQSIVKSLETRVSALESGRNIEKSVPAVIESPTPPVNEVTDIVEKPSNEERLQRLQDKHKK